MLQTFNCGIGVALIVSPADASAVLEHLQADRQQASLIGMVERANEPNAKPIVIVENLIRALARHCERINAAVDVTVAPEKAAVTELPSSTGVVATHPKARVGVLISGSGSNLQALIDWAASPDHQSAYEIVLVVSNVAGVQGLKRAQKAGIPILVRAITTFAIDY